MKFIGALLVVLIVTAITCAQTEASRSKAAGAGSQPPAATGKKPLSQIDISEIDQIAAKGRVQDKEYNDIEEIDDLIANGKDAIPFLIGKLEDRTAIRRRVIDYWRGQIAVGDLAFVILSDFSRDSTGTKTTIPGADLDSLLGPSDPDLPFVERLFRFVEKHGRKPIRQKWEKIWSTYKDRIVWDEQERCFKVVEAQPPKVLPAPERHSLSAQRGGKAAECCC
jgi:hypothetical protein